VKYNLGRELIIGYIKDKETGEQTGEVNLKSRRAYDFRFKANYISENNNGMNVFMFTATPTPNKVMEIYTMMRHLDPNIWREYGINSDKDFFTQFLRTTSVIKVGKEGTKDVLGYIANANALRAILMRYIDFLPTEIMPWIKIPEQVEQQHNLENNPYTREVMQDLVERMANLPP